jgi:hypothetical protein
MVCMAVYSLPHVLHLAKITSVFAIKRVCFSSNLFFPVVEVGEDDRSDMELGLTQNFSSAAFKELLIRRTGRQRLFYRIDSALNGASFILNFYSWITGHTINPPRPLTVFLRI